MATSTHFIAGDPQKPPKHDPEFIKEIFRQLKPWHINKIEVDGIIYLNLPRKGKNI